ncbi:MAG: inositol monophosphatase [Calditrichia bacterium]|nr:inositol monophosphatase [Calditrichia bacterium]
MNYLELAKEAAKLTGDFLLKELGRLSSDNITEKGLNDFVTTVDFQAEKLATDYISKQFPNHSILAEESGLSDQQSPYMWIIDPLDGTKNYIHNIPIFGVSIALMHEGEIVMGVVNHPAAGQMFWAEKDKGAYLNGERIHVSEHEQLQNALLATGFPHKKKTYILRYLQLFEQLFLSASDMRRMGSAAIDMVYVACGKMDAFFELGLSIWDLAAGEIIVREAGGRVTDFWGENNHLSSGYIIAGTPKVHKDILNLAGNYFPYNQSEK